MLVVGSGPNGLAAAVQMARAGFSVAVVEAAERIGGGARSAELTLPGFVHDICSAIHPLGRGSPFFRELPLSEHGLQWVQPSAPLAHPFDDGTAAMLETSISETARKLGRDDNKYRSLMDPIVSKWPEIEGQVLGPPRLPKRPLLLLNFAMRALPSAQRFIKKHFRDKYAQGLFAGLAAHSVLPLERMPSAAFGVVLAALGHTVGWPLPRGGAQQISNALESYFLSLGGRIVTGLQISHVDELSHARAVFLDVTPLQLLSMAGSRLPWLYRKQLRRYRYGPGVFKIDWALDGPIPWRATECIRAGTVHVGGTFEEIAAAEAEVWRGHHPEKPFVLVAQQSLFDCTRAPEGKHTAWAYCHVPNNSSFDMREPIEKQIERFAPGFRDRILARHARSAEQFEKYNPNCIGGDINGGTQDLWQIVARPVLRRIPYETPLRGIYLCSSSTPPGGGVHGMCGFHAARAALRKIQ